MASDQVIIVLKQRLESAVSERDGLQVCNLVFGLYFCVILLLCFIR
jgi:hypothetical protein